MEFNPDNELLLLIKVVIRERMESHTQPTEELLLDQSVHCWNPKSQYSFVVWKARNKIILIQICLVSNKPWNWIAMHARWFKSLPDDDQLINNIFAIYFLETPVRRWSVC